MQLLVDRFTTPRDNPLEIGSLRVDP